MKIEKHLFINFYFLFPVTTEVPEIEKEVGEKRIPPTYSLNE